MIQETDQAPKFLVVEDDARWTTGLLARISHQRRVEGRIFWYKWLSESHLEAREEAALNARLYFAAL